jgi:hypothetical protein
MSMVLDNLTFIKRHGTLLSSVSEKASNANEPHASPSPKGEKRMQPLTHSDFHVILELAAEPPARKPSSK